eukprot:TRINITY_DN60952_c0_g1_i1.p1 TRINITY_DN60952_c0_g1~~TRINITY_DN60952_c0_g1_i1.p1  ORF type:complete len:598 (-),score=80.82 TRINITY_DN60952_c0_g1_i1:78-1808(-)
MLQIRPAVACVVAAARSRGHVAGLGLPSCLGSESPRRHATAASALGKAAVSDEPPPSGDPSSVRSITNSGSKQPVAPSVDMPAGDGTMRAAAGKVGERPTLRFVARRSAGRGGDARVCRLVPWIYRDEVENFDELRDVGHPALLVDVENSQGRELGAAVCNLQKGRGSINILARMLTDNANAPIDSGFFAARMRSALQHREPLFGGGGDVTSTLSASSSSSSSSLPASSLSSRAGPSYRLLNGEGDQLPGVICDRFGDQLCLQFASAAMETLFETEILDALESILEPRVIVVRCDQRSDRRLDHAPLLPPRIARGNMPTGPIHLPPEQGNNFAFVADLLREGWTSGRYFQERHLRQVLLRMLNRSSDGSGPNTLSASDVDSARSHPVEQRVLSLFGESLGVFCASAASDGGGIQVEYVISCPQGKETDKNLEGERRRAVEVLASANGCSDRVNFLDVGPPGPGALGEAGRAAYDMVILEPPALAPTYGRLEDGMKQYSAWMGAAAAATRPRGLLVLVCRSRTMTAVRLLRCANLGIWSAGRQARLVHRFSAGGADFPINMGLSDTLDFQVLCFRVI